MSNRSCERWYSLIHKYYCSQTNNNEFRILLRNYRLISRNDVDQEDEIANQNTIHHHVVVEDRISPNSISIELISEDNGLRSINRNNKIFAGTTFPRGQYVTLI